MAFRPQRFGVNRPQMRPAGGYQSRVSQSTALVSYPIPIQKRHAVSGVLPVQKKMRMGVPATAAAGTAVVASSIGAVVPSVMTASKSENAVSVLNQYRHGLNYHVVSQVGPAHAPVFTVQVEVDGQTFSGTGVNKATARYNAAQTAVQALQPLITEDLKQRAANRIERAEQKHKIDQNQDGEKSAVVEKKKEFLSNDLGAAISVSDKEDSGRRLKGKNSLKVLREIRPGVVVAEKHIYGVEPGTYVASTVVDGKEFEGRGASLSLAKALAAEVAVRTLFNLEFEHSTGGFPVFIGDSSEYIRFRLENTVAVWDDDKNPVMQLNELYYESAVYKFTDDGYELPDGTVVSDFGDLRHGASVCVDGIQAYGRGITKKDAKTAAAAEAVKQLKACGLFQKRLTEKEVNKAQRSTADVHGDGASQIKPYRMVVTGSSLLMNSTLAQLSSENALAKLNKLYPGSTYELIESNTADILNTTFTMQVVVNGQHYHGNGRSKKQARLDAAENALRSLGHWTDSDDKSKVMFRKVVLAAKKTNTGKRSQNNLQSNLSVRGVIQRGGIQNVRFQRGGVQRGGIQRGGLQRGGIQRGGAQVGLGRGIRGQRGFTLVPHAAGGLRGRGAMKLLGAGAMGRGASFMSRGGTNLFGKSTGFGSALVRGRGTRGRGMTPNVDLTSFAEDSFASFGASGFEIGQQGSSNTVRSLMSLSGTISGTAVQKQEPKRLMNVGQSWTQQITTPVAQVYTKEQLVSYTSGNYASSYEGYSTEIGYDAENFASDNVAYSSFDQAVSGGDDDYSSAAGVGFGRASAFGTTPNVIRARGRGVKAFVPRGQGFGQQTMESPYSNYDTVTYDSYDQTWSGAGGEAAYSSDAGVGVDVSGTYGNGATSNVIRARGRGVSRQLARGTARGRGLGQQTTEALYSTYGAHDGQSQDQSSQYAYSGYDQSAAEAQWPQYSTGDDTYGAETYDGSYGYAGYV